MESEIYSKELLEKAYKRKAKAEKEKPKEAIEEAKEEVKEKEKKPLPLDELKNKKVTYVLRNGEKIEGILKERWKYEILVETGNSKILIFKHIIDYIIY